MRFILLEMEKFIHNLESMPIDASFESVLKVVEENLPKGYTTPVCRDFRPEGFYRARVHNHLEGTLDDKENKVNLFIDESEFWNVPENKKDCISIGRCNLERESVFYCSTYKSTAILEARPEKGKYISVVSFGLKNNDLFSGSLVNFIGRSYLSKIPEIDKITCFSNEFESREYHQIDNFLDDQFHKDIVENEKHLYKRSVAVTKCLMRGLMNEKNEILPMHGLVYSSIIRDKKTFNIMYEPKHVRLNYQIDNIQTFKVLDDVEDIIYLREMRQGKTSNNLKNVENDCLLIDWLEIEENRLYIVSKQGEA